MDFFLGRDLLHILFGSARDSMNQELPRHFDCNKP
jgi:hypothetical protein